MHKAKQSWIHPNGELNVGFRKFLLHRDMSKRMKGKRGRRRKREAEKGEWSRGGEEEATKKTAKALCDVFVSSNENDSISCLAGVC